MQMDVRSLAEWHRKRALRSADRSRSFSDRLSTKEEFHMQAAELVESLAKNERDRSLVAVEKDVKQRAVESLEKLAKAIVLESREFRRMLADEVSDEE